MENMVVNVGEECRSKFELKLVEKMNATWSNSNYYNMPHK